MSQKKLTRTLVILVLVVIAARLMDFALPALVGTALVALAALFAGRLLTNLLPRRLRRVMRKGRRLLR